MVQLVRVESAEDFNQNGMASQSIHTYLDLFSLPLTYLNFPYLSFAMQAWVLTKKFAM